MRLFCLWHNFKWVSKRIRTIPYYHSYRDNMPANNSLWRYRARAHETNSPNYNGPCTMFLRVCVKPMEWKFIPVMLRLTFRGRWWKCNFICVCVSIFQFAAHTESSHRHEACLVSSPMINEIIVGKNMWFSHSQRARVWGERWRMWVCRIGFIELYGFCGRIPSIYLGIYSTCSCSPCTACMSNAEFALSTYEKWALSISDNLLCRME